MKKLIFILPLLYYSCDSDFQHGKKAYLDGRYGDSIKFLSQIDDDNKQYDEARELLSDIRYKMAKYTIRDLGSNWSGKDAKFKQIADANNLLDQIDTNYSKYATAQEFKNKLRAKDLAFKLEKELVDNLCFYKEKYSYYSSSNTLKQKKYLKDGNHWFKNWKNKSENNIIDWYAKIDKVTDTNIHDISSDGIMILLKISGNGSYDCKNISFDNGYYSAISTRQINKDTSPTMYDLALNLEKNQTVKFSGKIISSEFTFNRVGEIRTIIDIEYTKIEIKNDDDEGY